MFCWGKCLLNTCILIVQNIAYTTQDNVNKSDKETIFQAIYVKTSYPYVRCMLLNPWTFIWFSLIGIKTPDLTLSQKRVAVHYLPSLNRSSSLKKVVIFISKFSTVFEICCLEYNIVFVFRTWTVVKNLVSYIPAFLKYKFKDY